MSCLLILIVAVSKLFDWSFFNRSRNSNLLYCFPSNFSALYYKQVQEKTSGCYGEEESLKYYPTSFWLLRGFFCGVFLRKCPENGPNLLFMKKLSISSLSFWHISLQLSWSLHTFHQRILFMGYCLLVSVSIFLQNFISETILEASVFEFFLVNLRSYKLIVIP